MGTYGNVTEGSDVAEEGPVTPSSSLPRVIQGGMGVAVSSWRLARAVSTAGELGVVSGTALDAVLARRLQDGDPDARRALDAFPDRDVAAAVVEHYYRPQGRGPGEPYLPTPRPSLTPSLRAQRLIVAGNFVEVWLAKQGHHGPVGVNYLEKIQMTTPWAAYGAMLAGVDVVLMGAGIPAHIPRLLDDLAEHRTTSLPVDVAEAAEGTAHVVTIDPSSLVAGDGAPLRRPLFLAIVANHVLAQYLARDAATRPDGFVVEAPTAGGHNAPPRGALVLDDDGQPVYGPRDAVAVDKLVALGLPFWLAGSYGSPEALRSALEQGAAGVQVGTLFALSHDSGFDPALRDRLLAGIAADSLVTRTDVHASPTGFPFKVAVVDGTLSDPALRTARTSVCDLGHLRTPFVRADGRVDYRCPAEPGAIFRRKGGDPAASEGRVCLCNALMATVGLGQTRRYGTVEPALVTLGDDLAGPRELLRRLPAGWSAADAVAYLRDAVPAS
ncbi:MAG: nitronate monooxygenase [Frankiales bacterium]|nr:nitronate monooxygenase [Frankiales bacterium]